MPFTIKEIVTGAVASTMINGDQMPSEQHVVPPQTYQQCYQVAVPVRNFLGLGWRYEYQTHCYDYIVQTPQQSYRIIYQ